MTKNKFLVVDTLTMASTCIYIVLNVKILICSLDFAKITDNASNWLMAERQIEHRKSSSVLSAQLHLTLYECSLNLSTTTFEKRAPGT